jgi:hypothetical protein
MLGSGEVSQAEELSNMHAFSLCMAYEMHGLRTSQLFDDNKSLRFMLQGRYAFAAFAIFYPQRLPSERLARIWRA